MMTPWMVEIKGEKFDIQELLVLNDMPDLTIINEQNRFYLRSKEFGSHLEAKDVFNCGINLVHIINGMAQLVIENWCNITVQGVARDESNGTRTQFIFPESIKGRTRIHAYGTVLKTDGTTAESKKPSMLELGLILAKTDANIEKALRLYGHREHNWTNLYIIYEVIESDIGGKEVILANKWASMSKINSFKRTANSVGAVGDDARHGKEITLPPSKPMSLSEAQILIKSLLHEWVVSKDLARQIAT